MIQAAFANAWLRGRVRLALPIAALSAWIGMGRGPAPGRDLAGLARALGHAAGGALVSPQDLRWEPSGGVVSDVALGRRVLFLARDGQNEARDVWRARVRLSPEGAALDVSGARDLTNTPLGDDHELVVRNEHAAFATRAYGQEQSLTVLYLAGEGAQNKTESATDRAMAAVTNLQQTGSTDGLGRVDLTLESPAAGAALALDDSELDIGLFRGERGRLTADRSGRVDLARGEISSPMPGVRAAPSMHLSKRFSHWVVDTLRAVPWIGPAPIAWVEDQALAARDTYRRLAFQAAGGEANIVVSADPPAPVLDSSQTSLDEAHWPPARIQSMWKATEKGEGDWAPPDVPWLRRPPNFAADALPAFYETFVRPDEERPYSKVLLVAMDTRQLDLEMEAGIEDPEPLTGPHGAGRIPRDPSIYRRVAAAFNGAFKTEHGHYGMMVHKRVLLPPVPGSATVVVLDDGRAGFGTWGADHKVGGIDGVGDDAIVSFRQNLDPLVDRGQVNPRGRNLWGFTLPGKGAQTERSGLCVTTSGHLLYAWGDDVSATTLAKAMRMGGCDYAMHLDMNPYHTGFLFAAIEDLGARKYRSALLSPAMSIPADRYIQYAPKDFFYVLLRDPMPPLVEGAGPWTPDGGTQPPPHWIPAVWKTEAGGGVELLDVEPGRVTWRIRAGAGEAPAASPLRELTGDESKGVLFAAGLGVASEKRPRGLATDGRLAVVMRGDEDSGALRVKSDGSLDMVRAPEAEAVDAHEDAIELPILIWDGRQADPVAEGAVEMRAAIGLTPSGRALIARGALTSAEPLAAALAQAGCTRALSLNRGTRATAFLDRAGTRAAPRSRYDESVLYAVAAPLRPRGFRFEPRTLFAQGSGVK